MHRCFLLLVLASLLIQACAGDGGYGGGHRHGKVSEMRGDEGGNGLSFSRRGSHASLGDNPEPIIVVEHSEAFSPYKRSSEKAVVLGTVACELWTRSLGEAQEGRMKRLNSYKVWVYGYLSGISATSLLHPLDDTDAASIDTFVTDYCKAHPGDTTALAAQAFACEKIGPLKSQQPELKGKARHP